MPDLLKPGLLLILTEAPGERFRAAAELAATVAALGRPVRVLVKGGALRALALDASGFALLFELGAEIIACQTDLAEAALEATALPPAVEAAGMLHALRGTEGWQLLLA